MATLGLALVLDAGYWILDAYALANLHILGHSLRGAVGSRTSYGREGRAHARSLRARCLRPQSNGRLRAPCARLRGEEVCFRFWAWWSLGGREVLAAKEAEECKDSARHAPNVVQWSHAKGTSIMNNPLRLRRLKTFTAVSSGLVLVLVSGCLIVPIPHSRTWAPAREGLVVNAKTGAPVANARVSSLHEKGGSTRTDGKGHFRLPPAKSWHGAYMCAIPISFSLFPTLDMPRRMGQGVSVSAAGFETYDESHLPSIENEWWPPVLPATIFLEPAAANVPETKDDRDIAVDTDL